MGSLVFVVYTSLLPALKRLHYDPVDLSWWEETPANLTAWKYWADSRMVIAKKSFVEQHFGPIVLTEDNK